MNKYFAQIPLLRLLVPFLTGIGFSYTLGINIQLSIFLAALISFIIALIFYRRLVRENLNWSGADGLLICIIIFLAGVAITSVRISNDDANELAAGEKTILRIRLLNDPVTKERSVKITGEVEAINENGIWKPSGKNILCYLQRENAASALQYGDVLVISGSPDEIAGPKNPGEFDYRAFLSRQGINRQVYAKHGEWKLIKSGEGNIFMASALRLRRYFIGKLSEYEIRGQEGGVAAALLLGASDQLDPGLLRAYSASGTLHVLSVSGMHVALVYLVLLRLLAPLQKTKYGREISIVIQLVFLWFYATLTGLCPSVLRSVTMLSVIIAGKAFRKNAHVLNSLAASAFILLVFDPMLLFDIGFQLSYLAVAGIVLLQPEIEKRFEPGTWIGQQAWTLVSITIVAQVFTFPLGLYYFRQFPTYFMLSNLVVIPLSTIAMYAGLLFLVLSPFSFIAKPLAVVFDFLLHLLNLAVVQIEHLPASVLRTASWSRAELILLYALIISLLVFLLRRRTRFLLTGCFLLGLLLTGCAIVNRERLNEKKIIVFDVKHGMAIGFINGKESMLVMDTAFVKKTGELDFHVQPFFEDRGIYDPVVHILNEENSEGSIARTQRNWIGFGTRKIFIADRSIPKATDNFHCDILILSGNTRCRLDSLIAKMDPAVIVADGTNGSYKVETWKKICAREKKQFFDMRENGAYVMELR
jgi:competence protein ComEC